MLDARLVRLEIAERFSLKAEAPMHTNPEAATFASIQAAEEQLKLAMLTADVPALDRLLAPELLFTNHLGQLLTKEDDLAAHRSGILKVAELSSSDQHIQIRGNVAIVSVRVQLSGTYDERPANGHFRFTRVWALASSITWRVVAAHSTVIA
jgi:ketosteroid isomerase-like protein